MANKDFIIENGCLIKYVGHDPVVHIPVSYINEEQYNDYRYLGPDYLLGAKGMTNEVLFHYILPAF